MPGATAKGYPYPVGTDRVADGDDAIKALAEAADTKAGEHATGAWSITNVPAGGGTASQVVTLPAGRFTAPPIGCTNTLFGNVSSSNTYSAAWIGTSTTSTITINARRQSGPADMSGNWIAVNA